MLTLHTSKLTENFGFNGEDLQVKSISAAWNKIREIRDSIPAAELNGTVLEVTGEEGQDMSRIPTKILFRINAKGKVEFKDLAKVQAREEAKKAKEAEKAEEPAA